MSLDYGGKTVGVAVSDPLGLTAVPVEVIRRKSENKMRRTLARIDQLIAEYGIETIILGLPVHMNTESSDRSQKSLLFKEILERRTGLSVVLWDERLTTVEACAIMTENGMKRKDRKKNVDKIAAAVILQDYLNDVALHRGED